MDVSIALFCSDNSGGGLTKLISREKNVLKYNVQSLGLPYQLHVVVEHTYSLALSNCSLDFHSNNCNMTEWAKSPFR